MIHQVNIALTDEEYKALLAEAGRGEEVLEKHIHKLLTRHLHPSLSVKDPLSTRDDVERHLYESGLIDHIPTHRPDTPEEEAELKRLADLFGQGKPVSEMVIEDRGPRE